MDNSTQAQAQSIPTTTPEREAKITKLVLSLLALSPEKKKLFLEGTQAVVDGVPMEEAFAKFREASA